MIPGSGGHCDYCIWKAPKYWSYCRWLLCLSQQLFQGLGTPRKTTTLPNSSPLSKINPFVDPAWQEARRLLAPGTAAGPRTVSHTLGTWVCSLQAWWTGSTWEGLPQREAQETSWEEPWKHLEAFGQTVSSPSPAISTSLQGCQNFLKQAFLWH